MGRFLMTYAGTTSEACIKCACYYKDAFKMGCNRYCSTVGVYSNVTREGSYLKNKKEKISIRSSAAEYLTYVASIGDQQDSIEMRYEDENIWLTQKMMAALYDVGLPTINEHIKKIYADSELEETATIRNFRIVQTEGSRRVSRDTKHYNLSQSRH